MFNVFKTILVSWLLLVVAACTSTVTDNRAPKIANTTTAASAAQTLEAETVLWKISKAGQPDSYLLGTIHVGKQGYQLPKSFQAALQNSKQLVIETEAADETYLMQHADEAQRIVATMAHTQPLKETLGSQRLAAVRTKFANSSAIAEMAPLLQDDSALAPWVVSFYLGYAAVPNQYSLKNGVDLLLLKTARQQNKPVVSLESGVDVLAMLRDNTPDDVAIRSIDDWLAHEVEVRDEAAQMLQNYEQGRISQLWQNAHGEALLRYVNPQDHAHIQKIMDEILLKQRNHKWLPKLLAELPKNSNVVAVGTAHLFGEHGLIALLRKNGYTVTPLPM